MHHSQFPRRFVTYLPTRLDGRRRELGGTEIRIKRNDCIGLSTSGNEMRQLVCPMTGASPKGADMAMTKGVNSCFPAAACSMPAAEGCVGQHRSCQRVLRHSACRHTGGHRPVLRARGGAPRSSLFGQGPGGAHRQLPSQPLRSGQAHRVAGHGGTGSAVWLHGRGHRVTK